MDWLGEMGKYIELSNDLNERNLKSGYFLLIWSRYLPAVFVER